MAASSSNPNNTKTQENQRRHRFMLLLAALDLEKLLGHRFRNLLRSFRRSQSRADMEPDTKIKAHAGTAKVLEMDVLDNWLSKLWAAAQKLVGNVHNTLQANIVRAQQAGTISQTTAVTLQNAVASAFQPSLLDESLQSMQMTEEEADANFDKETAEIEHEETREFVKTFRQEPRPTPNESHSESEDPSEMLAREIERRALLRMVRTYANAFRHLQERERHMGEARQFLSDTYRSAYNAHLQSFRDEVMQHTTVFTSSHGMEQLSTLSVMKAPFEDAKSDSFENIVADFSSFNSSR